MNLLGGGHAPKLREALVDALEARGVRGATHVVDGIEDPQLDSALGVVHRWDGKSHFGTGLLVKMLREDLGPPTSPDPVPLRREPSPRLLAAVRGSCRSPDGFDRDEARAMFAAAAKRHGLGVDELIDVAMGVDWTATAPHAALDRSNPDRAAEYERWVAGA